MKNSQNIAEGRLVEFKRFPNLPGRPKLGKVLKVDNDRKRITVKDLYGKTERIQATKVVRTWDEDEYRLKVEDARAASNNPKVPKPQISLEDVPAGRVIEFKKRPDSRGRPALGRVIARDRKKVDTIVVSTNGGNFSRVLLSNIVKVRPEITIVPPEVIEAGHKALEGAISA